MENNKGGPFKDLFQFSSVHGIGALGLGIGIGLSASVRERTHGGHKFLPNTMGGGVQGPVGSMGGSPELTHQLVSQKT